MFDIGSLVGRIELEDLLSGALSKVADGLKGFGKDADMALLAIGTGAAIAVTGLSAVTSAIIMLGDHGSDVNDVSDALDRFSGSAEKSQDILAKMREGTLGTIDNFTLMKSATNVLSAGVKLTADDFKTMTSAAMMLQNQGLGPTEQMLTLVSKALQTGNTRMLESKLGRFDLTKAEMEYAKQLGVSVKDLTSIEKLEAKRIGTIAALNTKVSEAGIAQRDFGEQLKFIQAQAKNLWDDVSAAVASSAVLKKGMDALADAIGKAFGYSNKTIVETTVKLVEEFVIIVVDVGIAAVEVARIFHVAWSAIKTVVLGVTAGIVGTIAALAETEAFLLRMKASLPFATAATKANAAAAADSATQWTAMTKSLDEEIKEAARGVVGNSQMDKTLDKLGGTLFTVRDAMIEAQHATDSGTKALKKHGDTAEETARQSREAAKEAEKLAAAQSKLFGYDTIANAQLMVKALGDVTNVSKLTTSAKEALRVVVEKALEVYKALGIEAPEALQRVLEATKRLLEPTRVFSSAASKMWVAFKQGVVDAGESLHDLASGSLTETAIATSAATKAAQDWANANGAVYAATAKMDKPELDVKDWKSSISDIGQAFGDMFEGINNKVAQVFKVAGNGIDFIIKKSGDLKAQLSAALAMGASILSTILGEGGGGQAGGAAVGALSGAAAGTLIMPGFGTAAGAVVGGILGWISAGKKAREAAAALAKDLKTMNQQIIATYGSTENLTEASMRVGRALIFSTNMTQKQTDAFKEQYAEMERRFKLVDEAVAKIINGTTTVTNYLAGSADKKALEDLGTQALASFAAVYKATGSFSAALQAITPIVTTLAARYKELGIQADNVYLKNLMILGQVQKNAPQLIAAIDGQTDSMQGMAQMGMLNEETFAAMQRTGTQLYQRLQAETSAAAIANGDLGDQTRNALIPMQGYLHEAAEQAALLNIPLDATTQMLIDQSQELGIWKDKGKSAQDLLIDGMNRLVTTLDKVIEKIFGVTSALNDIPDQDVNVNVHTNTDSGGVPTDENGEPIYRASGGMVPRGTDTVPAMLTPGERVLSVKQTQNLDDFLKSPAASAGDQYTFNVTIKAWDRSDMQKAVENDMLPMLTGALSRGRGKSDFKAAIK